MWFIVGFFLNHFFQSSTFAFFFKKNVWFPIQKDPCPKGPPRQALKECVSTWHLGCEFGIDDGWCREDDEWWYWVDGYHQGYLTARFNFTQLPSMLVAKHWASEPTETSFSHFPHPSNMPNCGQCHLCSQVVSTNFAAQRVCAACGFRVLCVLPRSGWWSLNHWICSG